MSPQDIAAYWRTLGEPLFAYPPEVLARLGIAPATQALLATVGLPRTAAPYLSFDASLERVSTLYNLPSAFAQFVQLGTDGLGNPIVLNTSRNASVEWLDHDKGFATHYINCSLQAFMVSLVAYRRFIEDLLATRGEDAYLDADFTDEQLTVLQQRLTEADAQALMEGGFWQLEISTLLTNRAEF
ncbi:hypothetical protein GO988_23145 [Hymenobacter sp. HMF4947]|uniref:SUKH-4 immunity protein of toxin-antitoxin system n=1 Tax=Hymenobacter ginkgonis TaxID=2682976 RepID=A0A7K1TLE5_9BACT|nr:SUKH-4 family immunity protein [Hymenobacter ginkgonis]MVN79239.1 hypothetical protein [Hymenobacter ginkgonis]